MRRTLNGLRVLNTRPKAQAQNLSKSIRAAGGISIELPTLEIQATTNWLNSLPDLRQMHQAIFVSVNAVKQCFTQLKRANIYWPTSIEVLAIGQSTANALSEFNVPLITIPEVSDSEHLLMINSLKQQKKHNILLVKGKEGRILLEETLINRGNNLTVLDVYQRVMPKINRQFVRSIWHDDLVDIILLTSEQSMCHLFKLYEEDAHPWLRSKTCLVLSERLAHSASSLGMNKIICSRPNEIMNTLFDYVIKD